MTEKQAKALCVPLSAARSWQRWGKTGGDSLHRKGKGREGQGRDGTGREGQGRNGREGTGRDGTGRDGKGREGKGREGKVTYLSLEAVDAGANLLTLGIVYRLHMCSSNNYS